MGRSCPGKPQCRRRHKGFCSGAEAVPYRSSSLFEARGRRHYGQLWTYRAVIARAAANKPYMPLTPEKAVRLRRVVFIIVNSGQAPSGTWSQTIEGPTGAALLGAVTDTAIYSAVRSGFDAFRLSIRDWEGATRKWRCSLSNAEARKLGASSDWRCSRFVLKLMRSHSIALIQNSLRD